MTNPEKFDFAREAQDIAETARKRDFTCELELDMSEVAAEIEAVLRRAYAAGQESMREAAAIGAHDFLIGARDCPYGRDKPGDPTWNHTEEDICPVCKKNGQDSATHCVETPSGRVAAAIRALPLEDKL